MQQFARGRVQTMFANGREDPTDTTRHLHPGENNRLATLTVDHDVVAEPGFFFLVLKVTIFHNSDWFWIARIHAI